MKPGITKPVRLPVRIVRGIGVAGAIIFLMVAPLYFGLPGGPESEHLLSQYDSTPAMPQAQSVFDALASGIVFLTSNSFSTVYARYALLGLALCALLAMILGHTPAVSSRSVMYAALGWSMVMVGMLFAEQKLPMAWKHPDMCAHFLLYGVWYLIAAVFFDKMRVRQIGLLLLIVSATFVCWWAIQQHLVGLQDMRQMYAGINGFDTFTQYTNSIDFSTISKKTALAITKLSSDRVFGTFVYPNALGGFLLIIIPVCIGLYASRPLGAVRLLSAAVLVLAIVTLMLSKSKAAIGITTFCLLVLLYYARRARALSNSLWIVFSLLVAAVCCGMLAWGYGGELTGRLQATGGARLDYWHAALKMIRDNPVRGYGSGGFTRGYLAYCRPGAEDTRLAHNAFLNIWTDYGLLGFIGLVLALVMPLLVAWYRTAAARPFNWLSAACFAAYLGFVLHCLVDFDFHIIGIVIPALTALVIAQLPVADAENKNDYLGM